jgi:hypothetical protein
MLQPPPPDLAVLLDVVRANPNDRRGWLKLASWLWDNGRDDEALVVRVLWRGLRDNVADSSLKATLAEVKRSARRLVIWARKIEARADDTPLEEASRAGLHLGLEHRGQMPRTQFVQLRQATPCRLGPFGDHLVL